MSAHSRHSRLRGPLASANEPAPLSLHSSDVVRRDCPATPHAVCNIGITFIFLCSAALLSTFFPSPLLPSPLPPYSVNCGRTAYIAFHRSASQHSAHALQDRFSTDLYKYNPNERILPSNCYCTLTHPQHKRESLFRHEELYPRICRHWHAFGLLSCSLS